MINLAKSLIPYQETIYSLSNHEKSDQKCSFSKRTKVLTVQLERREK